MVKFNDLSISLKIAVIFVLIYGSFFTLTFLVSFIMALAGYPLV